MMTNFKEQYTNKAIPNVVKQFGLKNAYQAPRIRKVTLNIGTSRARDNKALKEVMVETIQRISGQKAVTTIAHTSIASFKVREGQEVGLKVTLRGKRMFDFLEKLIRVTLPRVRDFRGISRDSFDSAGKSLTVGFKEHIAFPEVGSDDIDKIHGLEVNIALDSTSKEQSMALLKELGFPFRSEEQEQDAKEAESRAKAELKLQDRERKRKAKLEKQAQQAIETSAEPA
jgi:large subunit ribosomal protein L5